MATAKSQPEPKPDLGQIRKEIEAQVRAELKEENAKKVKKGKTCEFYVLQEDTKFWITSSRHVRQAGRSMPEYVAASPQLPVEITLPKGESVFKSDRDLRKIEPDKPSEKAMRPKGKGARGAPGSHEQ